jgi:RNA polymerase sigma-70 factor, ECF subfamily
MLFRNLSGEERFLERLQKRDEKAFNELVLEHEEAIFRLAYRMLGSATDAEDLAQEVFVQVFRSIDSFRGESKLSTWLYRITVNLSRNRTKYMARRKKSRHQDLEESQLDTSDGAVGVTVGQVSRPDLEAFGSELERVVVHCLQDIDPEFREVLVLRDVEGLSYEEIAVLLGVPPGTLKSRLHRARTELKRMVEAATGEQIG